MSAEDEGFTDLHPPLDRSVSANVDRQSASVIQIDSTKLLPWVAFSWLLSGGALIGLVLMALLMPEIINARVSAVVADERARTAHEMAEIRAIVGTTKTDAKLASTNTEKMWAQLDARGLLTKENH